MSDRSFIQTDEDDNSPYSESIYALTSNTNKGKRKNLTDLRHPRQKFCLRWETDFPWLRADKVDESIGICIVCNRRLVCKKSHLERHENSYKHQRLQKTNDERFDPDNEIKNEMDTTEFIGCGKPGELDENDSEPNDQFDSSEYNVEFELNPKSDEITKTPSRQRSSNPRQNYTSLSESRKPKLDRCKLLKCINRDRNELNNYFDSYLRRLSQSQQQMPKSRDSVDLFFESVSASVKTLPPKFAAEVKSKVSQIVADYELRAISERESEKTIVTCAKQEPMQSLTAITSDLELMETSAPAQVVYTFETK